MPLYPYQVRFVADVQQAFRGRAANGSLVRAVLGQMPTGGGKSASAIEGFIVPSVERGHRVIFFADLGEILDDAAARIAATGVRTGIFRAGHRFDPEAQVYVASLQTCARRLSELPEASRVIVDEAHGSEAATVRDVLARYQTAKVLGLTATPARGDGQPLSEFQSLVCGPSMTELIALGALVQPRVLSPERVLDKGVCEDPVAAVLTRAADRRCVVFAPDAASAADIAARLTAEGHPTVAVLDGMGREARKRVRDQLADGTVQSLVTVRALVKGFDAPVLDCAVLCTLGSITSYLQSIGRALRAHPASGKRDALVLDLRGAVWVHGLPEEDRAWTLEGSQGRPSAAPAESLRRCRACHAIFSGAKTRCPRPGCGAILVAHARGLRIQRAQMIEASGASVKDRAARYRDAIRDRLLKAGKPSHVAERVAHEATVKKFYSQTEQNEEVRNVG